MSDWKKIRLEELVEESRGLTYGVVQPGDFTDNGVPFIRVNNIVDKNFTEIAKIEYSVESSYNRSRLQGNELLITLVGTLGIVEKANEKMIGWNVARAIGVIQISENYDKDWLFLCLKSPITQKKIKELANITVQPTLNLKELGSLELEYLDNEGERFKIKQVIASFDKKIEYNISLNDTITALTEAIFRKIYRDTEGVGTFGDLTTQVSTRLGEQVDTEKITVLSAVKTGHLVRTEDYFSKQVSSDDLSNYKRVAPLSFAYNPARANIGSMGMNDLDTEGAVSPVYEVFRAKEGYHYWILMALKHPNIKRGIEGLCSGTVRQNLKYSDLASLNIKIPTETDIALFNTEYETLRKRYNHNLRQNETLIALRDGLLPKLMTGKITL